MNNRKINGSKFNLNLNQRRQRLILTNEMYSGKCYGYIELKDKLKESPVNITLGSSSHCITVDKEEKLL